MKLIINDKRYAALKSLGEKKQCFNEYLQQRKKGEKEEERQRLKRAKEACSWNPCFCSRSVLDCFVSFSIFCNVHIFYQAPGNNSCKAGETIKTCISW